MIVFSMPHNYNDYMPTGKFERTTKHKKNISKALSGKPKPWLRKKRVEKECLCGQTFSLTPGQVRKGHGKYCSRKCYHKYRKIYPVWTLSGTMAGEHHWNYKGKKASYSAFHLRVQKERGKATECDFCGKKEWVEWANMTGNYDDVQDYKPLCRSCHRNYDHQLKSQAVERR